MTSVGGSVAAPPPPLPPKESFVRRYKFLWPMILAVNLSVGAYLVLRTKRKDVGTDAGEVSDSPSNSVSSAAAITAAPPVLPAIVHEPISGEQQRELFKWILEEKRKLKPKDPEEKRRTDDEKAILKQFIRAKSIPSL
ncbi:uncharacterized protein LOC107822604 isoform X2 [Nicotiana tabacum]|uniref:Uncharacterized protein LOC107822604 isoform X2 n=2 Tax=Nicotiana tabacum TaxID=4097 RepID=A0A1S4CU40_TOBAC|nr:PREDICTED: uncharacterized protein LOC107822604 isoform X2 [Nicotiana tabacum]